jgi:hypothetical protein
LDLFLVSAGIEEGRKDPISIRIFLQLDQFRRFPFSDLDPGYPLLVKGIVERHIFFRGQLGGFLLLLQNDGSA